MSHNAFTVNGVEPDVNSAISSSLATIIRIGQGQSNNYSNSGGTLGVGADLYFYDTAPTNTIAGATLNGSGNWYSSVTLPAGQYLIRGYFSALFSATGQMAYKHQVGASAIGSGGYIGGTTNANYDGGSFASLGVTLASTTTISLRVYTSTNVSAVASQGTVPAEESWFIVEKLA